MKRIPQQPEVNIGTTGHVDHGKCLRWDQYALLNGVPVTGNEIMETVSQRGSLLTKVGGGSLYRFEQNSVVSINEKHEPQISSSMFYVEHYTGEIVSVHTRSGRELSVTPAHPLLVNRSGRIEWVRAKDLRKGDFVSYLPTIPATESISFPDPLAGLAEKYEVVTWNDLQQLKTLTADYRSFSSLSPGGFERLRILSGLSRAEFCRKGGLSTSTYVRLLVSDSNSVPSSVRARLARAASTCRVLKLKTDEFMVATKPPGPEYVVKLRHIALDEEFVKWLAVTWALASRGRGKASLNTRKATLQEHISISRKKFSHKVDVSEREPAHSDRPWFDYLLFKYGLQINAGSVGPMAPWLCTLPMKLKAAFLRQFFTLAAKFDDRRARILVTLRSERDSVILSYMLSSFGISPSFVHRGGRHILVLSGPSSLGRFSEAVGLEHSLHKERLERCLLRARQNPADFELRIPVDPELLKILLERVELGVDTTAAARRAPIPAPAWRRAYIDAIMTGRASKADLRLIVKAVDLQLERVGETLEKPSQGFAFRTRGHAQLTLPADSVLPCIPLQTRGTDKGREFSLFDSRGETRKLFKASSAALEQLRLLASTKLEFDPITSIKVELYDGLVFDLSVPEHANFLAGNGGLVCHNTTITEALTGKWTSAHSEELRRGITIRVGYADAAVYKCTGCPPPKCYNTAGDCADCGGEAVLQRVISVVDSPGHESLMANMLSGAAIMDGALIVIAANELVPQPQTKEHVQALQMVGVKNVVVVQNKIDLVTYQQALDNMEKIRAFLGSYGFDNPKIVPVSAQRKLNIDALIQAMEESIPTPKRDPTATPLMYVLRSFDVNLPGTSVSELKGGVVGGTLLQGTLKTGDEIEIRPGIYDSAKGKYVPVVTKVSSLATSAGLVDSVHPGGLVAVGTLLDPSYAKSDSLAGNVIGTPGTLPPEHETITFQASLFDSVVGVSEAIKVDPIKMGEVLRLNVATATTAGSVVSFRGKEVSVKLRKPVCAQNTARVAISRRIGDRWRLIGSGTITG